MSRSMCARKYMTCLRRWEPAKAPNSFEWEEMRQMGLETHCKRPGRDTKGFEDYKVEVFKQSSKLIRPLKKKNILFPFLGN